MHRQKENDRPQKNSLYFSAFFKANKLLLNL